jgi:hypothetical protein
MKYASRNFLSSYLLHLLSSSPKEDTVGITELEHDLRVIRQTMESSSRYKNVPASGYVLTGLLGIAGTWGTYLYLGQEKVADTSLVTLGDVKGLVTIWGLVFVAAVASMTFCAWNKARRYERSAWNSLVARMLRSQIPLVLMVGALTLAMALEGYYSLIPGMWLGIYGTVLYSFSYSTSMEHKIEGIAFMALGVLELFVRGSTGLILLGIGFGGIHLTAGIWRAFSAKRSTWT